jgi:hypothetical protein
MDIDNLTQQGVVVESFEKALNRVYGKNWPSALRLALGETVWAKDLCPLEAEAENVDQGRAQILRLTTRAALANCLHVSSVVC